MLAAVWQLLNQACAIHEIEHDGDLYIAMAAVSPTAAAPKVLQPGRLKEPFTKYVATHDSRRKVEWALEAIAHLTTPTEFRGFVSLRLAHEPSRSVLLSTIGEHPFCGSIPRTHLDALCPVFLTFAREHYRRGDKLPDPEREALPRFIRLLGETRYQPAIPVLKGWFEEAQSGSVDSSLTPLATMGSASLDVLVPYLNSAKVAHRLNAIQLLTISS